MPFLCQVAIMVIMDQSAKDIVAKTVARMPEWIRHDLTVKDSAVRVRAEESLAAMLVAALENDIAGND